MKDVLGKRDRGNGNYESAFKYCAKAAALGDAQAHFELSMMYRVGEYVEQDEKKEVTMRKNVMKMEISAKMTLPRLFVHIMLP